MKKAFIMQKLVGVLMIVLTGIYIWVAKDATAAIITVPLGILLIFSKELIWGYDENDEDWYL